MLEEFFASYRLATRLSNRLARGDFSLINRLPVHLSDDLIVGDDL
jgi:hypothetical protein